MRLILLFIFSWYFRASLEKYDVVTIIPAVALSALTVPYNSLTNPTFTGYLGALFLHSAYITKSPSDELFRIIKSLPPSLVCFVSSTWFPSFSNNSHTNSSNCLGVISCNILGLEATWFIRECVTTFISCFNLSGTLTILRSGTTTSGYCREIPSL